jgi:hypothetical protein
MTRTLHATREAFVAAMKRDTSGTELPRLVGVLDALIKWSVARPNQLALKVDDSASAISFERVDSKAVFWSARVTRGDAPRLEICPPTARCLSAEERTKVMEALNANSRAGLTENDRLRIGFGALKNVGTRTPILAVLDELLASVTPPVQTARSA